MVLVLGAESKRSRPQSRSAAIGRRLWESGSTDRTTRSGSAQAGHRFIRTLEAEAATVGDRVTFGTSRSQTRPTGSHDLEREADRQYAEFVLLGSGDQLQFSSRIIAGSSEDEMGEP